MPLYIDKKFVQDTASSVSERWARMLGNGAFRSLKGYVLVARFMHNETTGVGDLEYETESNTVSSF